MGELQRNLFGCAIFAVFLYWFGGAAMLDPLRTMPRFIFIVCPVALVVLTLLTLVREDGKFSTESKVFRVSFFVSGMVVVLASMAAIDRWIDNSNLHGLPPLLNPVQMARQYLGLF